MFSGSAVILSFGLDRNSSVEHVVAVGAGHLARKPACIGVKGAEVGELCERHDKPWQVCGIAAAVDRQP